MNFKGKIIYTMDAEHPDKNMWKIGRKKKYLHFQTHILSIVTIRKKKQSYILSMT